jgi:hypothetical protein
MSGSFVFGRIVIQLVPEHQQSILAAKIISTFICHLSLQVISPLTEWNTLACKYFLHAII